MKTKMQRAFSVTLLLSLFVNMFAACGDKTSNALDLNVTNAVCVDCGEEVGENDNFCPNCGFFIMKTEVSDESDEAQNDGYESYTVLSYLKSVSDKPLILYYVQDIAKNEKVTEVYVVKNGKCRKYKCSKTLGELSKMTDDEIMEMLDYEYENQLDEAIARWKSDESTRNAIESGKVKLYQPQYMDITGCLFTDDTGNNVVGELLFFPLRGICDWEYVIYHPEYSEFGDAIMDYYSYNHDYSNERFNNIMFDTSYGNGTKPTANNINDLYYIEAGSITAGSVYNSNYYGFKVDNNVWSNRSGVLCFREANEYGMNIVLDNLSSSDIEYIDPSGSDIGVISSTYYSKYYSSFVLLN